MKVKLPLLQGSEEPRAHVGRRHVLGGLALVAYASGCGDEGGGASQHGAIKSNAGDDGASGNNGGDDAASCTPTCGSTSATFVLTFADHPQLAKEGGSAVFTDSRYKDPFCGGNDVIVVRESSGKFVAFSRSCTHACCFVAFNGDELRCPCHGSTFDLNGNVTGGPASDPLPKLSVCSDDCGVYVKLR
jgi:nitrite reductase/ring-hydroxylating ferredoxin subunit